jgi:hypothetical protein
VSIFLIDLFRIPTQEYRSTNLLIEPVPTVFPIRVLKTFLTLLNSDFRSNAKRTRNFVATTQEPDERRRQTLSQPLLLGRDKEILGDRCPKVKMSAGMFYTDTFIEVAVPFPPCRNRIPVIYTYFLRECSFAWIIFP